MRRFGVWIVSLTVVRSAKRLFLQASPGGGLPPHIATMAIVTFENQTASPDLPKELYDQIARRAPAAFGRT